jgi:hypothetical protein
MKSSGVINSSTLGIITHDNHAKPLEKSLALIPFELFFLNNEA